MKRKDVQAPAGSKSTKKKRKKNKNTSAEGAQKTSELQLHEGMKDKVENKKIEDVVRESQNEEKQKDAKKNQNERELHREEGKSVPVAAGPPGRDAKPDKVLFRCIALLL